MAFGKVMKNIGESLTIKENDRINSLRENFCNLFENQEEAAILFKEVAGQYQADNRFYHNLEHIENLLNFLKQQKQQIINFQTLTFAAWFHDVVYDARAQDNEEQSAKYSQSCLRKLGVSEEVIKQVTDLILATKKHEVVENNLDLALFLDGDLAVLGSDERKYNEYAAKIRQEYHWLSDDQYKMGRRSFLENLLNRSKIFFVEDINQELEQQARRNIKSEIDTLS